MSKLKSLHDLYVEHLQDLHSAELQLTKALPKMAQAATDPTLKAAFTRHLAETEVHLERIEALCRQLNVPAKGETCINRRARTRRRGRGTVGWRIRERSVLR